MSITPETPVGTPVKLSESSIRPKRDYWLSQGRCETKSSAKQALDEAIARRGTLKAITKGKASTFATVEWSDGGTSDCLLYTIQTA